MDKVHAEFAVIKVNDNTWDVVVMGEPSMLKAFEQIYDNLFYIEESVFANKPAVIAPDFPNSHNAETWKQYWIQAFADPDNACKTCPTVNELLALIEKGRNE
jgi:hypothetical protein